MSKAKKPNVCDFCSEEDKLHWSKEYDGWICDLCKEELEEKDMLREYERGKALEYMSDEDYDGL